MSQRCRSMAKAMAFALASVLVTSSANAGDARGARPVLSSLPDARLAPLGRQKAPARIGAGEKVSGFYLAQTPAAYPKQLRPSFVMLFPSKTAYDNTFGNARASATAEQETTCFVMSHGGEDGRSDVRFGPSTAAMLTIPATRERHDGSATMVRAVRAERFVPKDGRSAALEVTEAWVDPTTRGARLIRQASLPLTKVEAGAGGLEVWAVREGNTAVKLVVTRTATDPRRRFAGNHMTVMGDGGVFGSSNCTHSRARLKLQKNGGDVVTVQGEIALPGAEEPAAEPASRGEPRGEVGLLGRVFGSPAVPAHQGFKTQEIRLRQFRISGSTSWTSSDREPLLAVSMGWIGRERTMQIVVPE